MSTWKELTDGVPYGFELPAQATPGDTSTVQVSTFSVPFDGIVTYVALVPRAAITANGTNFAAYTLQNKGTQGSGTTTVATRSWAATNSVAGTKELATLGTATNREVKAGDTLQLARTIGGTGLATPAMAWIINILPR